MVKSIEDLIELARTHEMTPNESAAQAESFTFGNTSLENETITKEDVAITVASIDQNGPLLC